MKKIFTMMVVFAASVASAFADVWTPEYNDNLEATVPFSALKADGGIKIEQEKEGAIKVTSDGTGGKLAIELPDEGIDISNGFVVTFTGDNGLFSRLDFSSKDNGSLGGLYGSKYVYNAKTDNSRIGKLRHVNKMEWIGTNTAGTMVITSIVIKKLFKLAADEVNLTTSMFRDWTHWDDLIDNGAAGCTNAIGDKLDAGGLLYGNGSVLGKTFADLTGYKALRIYASEGDQFRILMNRPSDNGEVTAPEETITADASGVATLDISKYEEFHLNAIKLPWNGRKNVTVKAIALVYGDSPVFSETSYWNPISKTTLQPNVTRNLVAGLNTICLPFNVDASEFGSVFGDADAKAYQFTSVEDNKKLCFEEATSIEAGVPYLLKVAKDYEMSNVGEVEILVEEPKSVTVEGVTFKGTFNVKVLGEKNLFLGKDGNLKVPASTEGDNNKLKGMRAFFVLPEATTAYSLSFGGETTGIQAIEGEKAEKAQGVYTISGVKVADNTANLAKGLYIVNGKKFIQK